MTCYQSAAVRGDPRSAQAGVFSAGPTLPAIVKCFAFERDPWRALSRGGRGERLVLL